MIARLALLLLLLVPRAVSAETATYARVIVDHVALRSGPGASFRMVQTARRDDAFRVRGRAVLGHWLEVELSDGGRAYLQGDAVWLYDPSEGERPPHERFGIFAPPPLLHSDGELAVTLGVLGDSGFLAVRPSYMIAPTFAFEANLGASVGSTGRLFVIGGGGLVNLFPSWPVTPFFTVGGGAAHAAPNSDAFIFSAGTRSMLYAGGGLRFGFRHRLILRVEGRNYALFEPDELVSRQEISGGLSAFF
jgi:hypothetical protein